MARGPPAYGPALQHPIFLEVRAYFGYQRLDHASTFWRSQSKLEVDSVIGDEIALGVKNAELASQRAFTGLRALADEVLLRRKLLVCNEKASRRMNDWIEVLPLEDFLRLLWRRQLL